MVEAKDEPFLSHLKNKQVKIMITDSKCIADEFNDFFVNVGPNLAAKINCTGKSF